MHNIVQQKAFFELETKKMLEHDMFYKLRKIYKKVMKKHVFIFHISGEISSKLRFGLFLTLIIGP